MIRPARARIAPTPAAARKLQRLRWTGRHDHNLHHAHDHHHPDAADRFLDAVGEATVASADDIQATDVRLDATVPGWRLGVRGDDAVRAEYARWISHAATLEELDRHTTADGEVLESTMGWIEDAVPHAARHAHVLTIDRDADRITADHVWCAGRWPASLLAEIDAAFSATLHRERDGRRRRPEIAPDPSPGRLVAGGAGRRRHVPRTVPDDRQQVRQPVRASRHRRRATRLEVRPRRNERTPDTIAADAGGNNRGELSFRWGFDDLTLGSRGEKKIHSGRSYSLPDNLTETAFIINDDGGVFPTMYVSGSERDPDGLVESCQWGTGVFRESGSSGGCDAKWNSANSGSISSAGFDEMARCSQFELPPELADEPCLALGSRDDLSDDYPHFRVDVSFHVID